MNLLKLLYCLFIILFTSEILYGQKFYGTTSQGGEYGVGAIISYDPKTNTLPDEAEYSFFTPNIGRRPRTELIEYNGLLYGTTLQGGFHGGGTIFSYNPVNGSHTTLFNFNSESGYTPSVNSLTLYNGKLYGTTTSGGTENGGTIFSFDLLSNIYGKLFDFERTVPYRNEHIAGLTLYKDKLYGTTQHGGDNNDGTLFSIEPESGIYQKLFDFEKSISGSRPNATLTVYKDKLYGSTTIGGENESGILFSFDPNTSDFQKLFDFNKETPSAALTVFNGKLYGSTNKNGVILGGALFAFDPMTNTFETLFEFDFWTSGGEPYATLKLFNGLLYGSTINGGQNGSGTIFSFDPVSVTFQKLFDITETNSRNRSYTALTPFNDIMYGVLTSDNFSFPVRNVGTLFSFDPENRGFENLIEFGQSNDGGRYPESGLVEFKRILYGTTMFGGDNDNGIIYSFDPLTGIQRKLFDFDEFTSGSGPAAGLTLYENIFYGATREGGLHGHGTLFSFDPSTESFQILFDFDEFTSGSMPSAALTLYNDRLYGSTIIGGANDDGTLFLYDLIEGKYQKLYDFDRIASGEQPYASLTFYNNRFYGLTGFGGINGNGVIFSLDPITNEYQKLIDLDSSIGFLSVAALVPFGGKLYGSTRISGGTGNYLFVFDPITGLIKKLTPSSFDGLPGLSPAADFILFEDKLYGTTLSGGVNLNGTIFSIDPTSDIYSKLNDFSWFNGAKSFSPFTLYSAPDTLVLFEEETTDTSLTLKWNYYSDSLEFDLFEIFQITREDTLSLGNTTENSFIIDNLIDCTDYSFIIEASNSLGNSRKSNIFEVTTTDKTAPLVPELLAITDTLGKIEITIPEAIDNCEGIIEGTTTDSIIFNSSGEYTITWTFTDASGNSSQAIQNVTVLAPTYSLSLSINLPAESQEVPLQVEIYQVKDSLEVIEEQEFLGNPILFEDFLEGQYIVKVVPDQNLAPELLTTYSGDALLLSEADTITLTRDVSYSINLRVQEQQNEGNGTIEGVVIGEENNTGGRLAQGMEEGMPLANVPVYVISENNGELAANTVSGDNGLFRLENLALGSYILKADYEGKSINLNNSKVELNVEDAMLQVSVIIGEEEIRTQVESVTGIPEELLDLGLTLYPNPVEGKKVFIGVTSSIGKVEIGLYSSNGKMLSSATYPDGTTEFSMGMDGLTKGLYMLRLKSKKGNAVWKVVKK